MPTDLVSSAFYVDLGSGRHGSTERTEGPWSAEHQHAGPPCALPVRALEACSPRLDMQRSWVRWMFINTDLTIHVTREPRSAQTLLVRQLTTV